MNRLGTERTILVLIMSLLILIIFMGFHYRQKQLVTDITTSKICKESVRLSSQYTVQGVLKAPDIECPVQYATITKDQDVKKEIADRMVTCWDNYHEGVLEFFNPRLLDDVNYCMICYQLEFDDVDPISDDEFLEFLQETKTTVDIDGEKEKMFYQEYMMGYRSGPELIDIAKEDRIHIDTSQPVMIAVMYSRLDSLNKIFALSAGGGFAAGIAGGGGSNCRDCTNIGTYWSYCWRRIAFGSISWTPYNNHISSRDR